MPKLTIAVAISLLTGFAVAALVVGGKDAEEPVAAASTIGFDQSGSVNERLQALEEAVNAERQARQLLEDELLAVYDALDVLERDDDRAEDTQTRSVAVNNSRADFRNQFGMGRADPERRLAALTEAGFSASRADWILQRESELRMESMQARYEATRAGEPLGPGINSNSLLREEIGDADYERYLAASGRPTTVGVTSVFQASPALTAGLQPGDEITHYGGERVFSVFDLTRQTMQGDAGANVVVNIVRDGTPMQVVLPRGPLGISTSRRRTR
jgi:hypothetical protein